MSIPVNLREKQQIVIAKDAPYLLLCAARRFSEFLGIPYVTDEAPELEKEILLGQTCRPETVKVRPDVCRIFCRGEKAVFAAVHYQPLCEKIVSMIAKGQDTVDFENTRDYRSQVPLHWGEYELVWNDEFDGGELDFDRWTGNPNMSMNDVVLSVKPGTVDVKDSKLILTTTIIDRNDPKARYKSNYSIMTGPTMNFRYGYMEIRAKVPRRGGGEWPSYWFLSYDSLLARADYEKKTGHDWGKEDSYNVEIDMFESFSQRYLTESALHKWGHDQGNGAWHEGTGFRRPDQEDEMTINEALRPDVDKEKRNPRYRGQDYVFTPDEEPNDWHTYGLLWTEKELGFVIDGNVYLRYDLTQDFGKNGSGMGGFHRPLHVLFNNMLYTEGYMGAQADRCQLVDSFFPLVYEIDYCRLYQLPDDEKSELYTPAESGCGAPLLHVDRRDHGKYYSDGQEPTEQA